MLINDLEYYTVRANYRGFTCGMDHPKWYTDNGRGSGSVEDWDNYRGPQSFDYQFNSWGFRGPEYAEHIGKPVNICLGDSFTVNVGGPIDYSWPARLAEHFDIPTLNLGMDGAGNDAIHLVYDRACKLFDVQDTFVMYSYLHRRLVDNYKFVQAVAGDEENFNYFLKHRVPNVYECALPAWAWNNKEANFIIKKGIYFFNPSPLTQFTTDHLTPLFDRSLVNKDAYNNFSGGYWPTYEEFLKGATPHPDMFTEKFGTLVSHVAKFKNRDGHHMDRERNQIYADHLYNQWKLKNES